MLLWSNGAVSLRYWDDSSDFCSGAIAIQLQHAVQGHYFGPIIGLICRLIGRNQATSLVTVCGLGLLLWAFGFSCRAIRKHVRAITVSFD